MKWVKIFLFVGSVVSSFAQVNITFTELRGLDDSTGNTHLIYRAGWNWNDYNPVYHFDLNTFTDTFFIDAYYYNFPWGVLAKGIEHYQFWKNNPRYFIYGGEFIAPDNHAYVQRFDGYTNYSMLPKPTNIEISKQNDSLVFVGWDLGMFISTDGGKNFLLEGIYFPIISVNQNEDKILFGWGENSTLIKSIDTGKTFIKVDTLSNWDRKAKMYYDQDGNHIYAVSGNKLLISSNNGDSWFLIRTYPESIYLSIDNAQTGNFYVSSGKDVFLSVDYGATITLYKMLNERVVGIYKKPSTNKLYAATSTDIYEITQDSIRSIKRLKTSVDNEETFLPNSFTLYQNFPNPFNSSTKIRYSIPRITGYQSVNVTLKIFDILGREVATLFDGVKEAGTHTVTLDPRNTTLATLKSGVYFYQLRAGEYVETKKMLFLK